MQNVSSFRHEFTCPVSPARMFQALFLDSHNLIPLLVPEAIKSIEFIEGDGGAGSIKQTTFIEGGQMKIVKHRIDDIDKENFTCRYSLIEGDILFNRLESAGYEVKFEASGDGGSICKISSAYQTKTAVQLNEKDMKMAKDKAMGLCKVIQDYLLANPNVYN